MTTSTISRTIDHEANLASHTRDADTLTRLAHHSEMRVKFLVAYNPNTPVEVLTEFATDDCSVIRRGVAKNPRTPVELLVELSHDPDYIVRKATASNRATPLASLSSLTSDDEKEVSEIASHSYEARNIVSSLA